MVSEIFRSDALGQLVRNHLVRILRFVKTPTRPCQDSKRFTESKPYNSRVMSRDTPLRFEPDPFRKPLDSDMVLLEF
jgi:hypothetical protein